MSTLQSVIAKDIFANRPAAGIPGRLFFASDINAMFRDNGTTWDTCSAGGTSVKTGAYTLLGTDNLSLIVANSSSAITLTLPASPPNVSWNVEITCIGTGTCTIARNGLNIDGAASNVTLSQYQGITVSSDGSNYFTNRGMNNPVESFTSVTVSPSTATSYSNAGGTGDRHLLIQGYVAGSANSVLVDGVTTYGSNTGWISGSNAMEFDFGLGIGAVLITEATLYIAQQSASAGTAFTWQGSNDNATWSTIATGTGLANGSSFTAVDTGMSANTTFYRYYRANWGSGAGIQLSEVQFKICPAVAATNCLTVGGAAAFNGNAAFAIAPTAPTQAGSDNSTKVATTAFVPAYLKTLTPNAAIANVVQKAAAAFTSQTTVAFTHNLATSDVDVRVYDGSGNQLTPSTVVATSVNVVTVTFASSTTGRVVVFG